MSGGEVGRAPRRAALVAFGLAIVGSLWLIAGFVVFPHGDGWGYDYRAYHDAAVRLAESGSLYQAELLDGPYRPGPYGLYMYAPPLGIAVAPLTALSIDAGTLSWYLVHVVALGVACALMPVRTPVRLATFGVASLAFATTRDLVLGNVSVLLLVPLAATWRWLDRPLGSVAQAIAMAVRPTLGVLLIWQLLRRRWHAVAWTLVAGLVLVVLTLPFVGMGGYLEYLEVLRNLSDVSGVTRNSDLGSMALALGADPAVASLALIAGYGLAIGAIGLSLRRDRELGFIVTVAASLLLSPLLWDHYLAMLVLPAAFLAQRGHAWGLLLPLATWLPPLAYPLLAIAGTLLPFITHPATSEEPADSRVAAEAWA